MEIIDSVKAVELYLLHIFNVSWMQDLKENTLRITNSSIIFWWCFQFILSVLISSKCYQNLPNIIEFHI